MSWELVWPETFGPGVCAACAVETPPVLAVARAGGTLAPVALQAESERGYP